MNNILGLDLGNKTGWSVWTESGRYVASGVHDYTRIKNKGEKWAKFCMTLDELHAEFKPTKVYYEEAKRHLGIYAAHEFGGFQAMMNMVFGFEAVWRDSQVAEIIKLSPTNIKKLATGKGNASKELMVEAAKAKWPCLIIIDDNHADALFIGWIGAHNKQQQQRRKVKKGLRNGSQVSKG